MKQCFRWFGIAPMIGVIALAVAGCKPVDNGESFSVRIATSQNGEAVTSVTATRTIYAVLGDFVNLEADSTTDQRSFELFVNDDGKGENSLRFENWDEFDLSDYGVSSGDTIKVKVKWTDAFGTELATAESPTVTVN